MSSRADWPLKPLEDRNQDELKRQARELRATGLSTRKIAMRLGVSVGSVEWWLLPDEKRDVRNERRRAAAQNEVFYVTCPQCLTERTVLRESYKKIQRGVRKGYCGYVCKKAADRGIRHSKYVHSPAEWMTDDEREPIEEWAIRVVGGMTDNEKASIELGLDPLQLEAEDRSEPAKKRRKAA